jgi:hypothetical protein
MSNIPAETNIPHSISYEIVIDSVETETFGNMENIIKSIHFHVRSFFEGKTFEGKNLCLNLDFPNSESFKNFSEFTKAEILELIETKMFDEIITSKTELNSRYYVVVNTYSPNDLPWN